MDLSDCLFSILNINVEKEVNDFASVEVLKITSQSTGNDPLYKMESRFDKFCYSKMSEIEHLINPVYPIMLRISRGCKSTNSPYCSTCYLYDLTPPIKYKYDPNVLDKLNNYINSRNNVCDKNIFNHDLLSVACHVNPSDPKESDIATQIVKNILYVYGE